jgi:hypothetical protein
MLPEEASWLGARLASLPDEQIFPLLNIGSSTGRFRSVTQPHIDKEIFARLAERGGAVQHVDIKRAPGVDIVGDLHDPAFSDWLRSSVAPRAILVSNLLEHVYDPAAVARVVTAIAPPGGLIIVSGPHAYPYHPDPIDTRFRPSLEEVHALFPGTRLLEGEIVRSQVWRPWAAVPAGGVSSLSYFARLALPIYRPSGWRRRLSSLPFVFRQVSAYAAILAKEDTWVASP